MSRIVLPIPDLWRGVSQQAPIKRPPGLASLQENIIGTPVDGLSTRPGTRHVAFLESNWVEGDKVVVVIDNDPLPSYFLIFTRDWDEPLELFRVSDGHKLQFKWGSAFASYAEDVEQEARDYLVNNLVTGGHFAWDSPFTGVWTGYNGVTLSQGSGGTFGKFVILTGSATPYPGFLQTVTGLTQGASYRFRFKHRQQTTPRPGKWILKDGTSDAVITQGTFTTGASWVEVNETFVATSGSVKVSIQIESGSPSGMSFAIDEVYLYEEASSTPEDYIRTADRDLVTFVINRRRIVKREFWSSTSSILGTVTKFADLPVSPSVGDVYRISRNPESGTPSCYVKWTSGSVWSETVNPEEDPDEPSRYTMPHVVQIKPEWNTFYFSPRTWSARQVGDRETNPAPPFFGNAIAEVFTRSGRLGLLAGSSICLSRLNGTRNFFASTALEVRDTDPIIVGVARERFLSAAAFDRNLVFLTETGIVLLSGVTPSTVTVTQMNAPRPADRKTISIGADLYYPTKSEDEWIDIRGINIVSRPTKANKDGTYLLGTTSLLPHAPNMIPAGRLVSAVDLTRDTFYLRSSGDYSSLFVVRAVRVGGNDGFTGIVSTFTFGGGDPIAGLAAYDSGLSLVIKRPEGLALEWLKLVAEPGDSFVDRKGYAEGETAVVGRYRFTRPFVNDPFGRPIVGRRVQIFGMNFDVVSTKSVKVVVRSPGREDLTLEVSESNTTSMMTLKDGLMTGRASVGVRGDAEKTSVELLLDSGAPCFIAGVEWVVVLEAGAGRRHR